ncbi:MAG: hypothetical protein V4683_13190 [Bacteroidota bacterium]
MEIVNTRELIEKLILLDPNGLEVSTRMGFLTTTKAVYHKKGLFFIFNMEFDFSFKLENGIKEEDFTKKYEKWFWEIDQIIS